MHHLTTLRRCAVAVCVLAVLFGAASAGHAAVMRGPRETSEGYHHSDTHRAPHVEGHREGDRERHHGDIRPRVYWVYPYGYYYPPAPKYWYYCESYGAYFPYVKTCPESWIIVPSS